MKVSDFNPPVAGRKKGTPRDSASYRAARREMAKSIYRQMKRQRVRAAR